MGQEAILQAGQELQQVSSTGEAQRWPLDAILAHQDNRATAVHCWQQREQAQPSVRGTAQAEGREKLREWKIRAFFLVWILLCVQDKRLAGITPWESEPCSAGSTPSQELGKDFPRST